jgi:two-component system phosphate regulon sensor histidine kinase PhoR
MYAEMLEKNWVKSADKLTEYYHSLRQESERLSRLVDNVLDFSRIQKGRKKYAFEVGDINHCVTAVSEMMKPYAQQYGFGIRLDLGRLRETRFDRDAVTQIVVNLIDNAVKYARSADDKTIRVRTRAEGPYTVIEVEDHGPGIPHRQRKKVFEQFYRCSDDRGAAEQAQNPASATGAGLGLTLVKRFAEAHHGFVEILSAQPTGAILKVSLALTCQ